MPPQHQSLRRQTSNHGNQEVDDSRVASSNSYLNHFFGSRQPGWMASGKSVKPTPRQNQPPRYLPSQPQPQFPARDPQALTLSADQSVLPSPAPSDEPSPAVSNKQDSPNPNTAPDAVNPVQIGGTAAPGPQISTNEWPVTDARFICDPPHEASLYPTANSSSSTGVWNTMAMPPQPGIQAGQQVSQEAWQTLPSRSLPSTSPHDLGRTGPEPMGSSISLDDSRNPGVSTTSTADGAQPPTTRSSQVGMNGQPSPKRRRVENAPPNSTNNFGFGVPSTADYLPKIAAFIISIGGDEALSVQVEQPRMALLKEATSRGDVFFLALHQLYAIWSLNRSQAHQIFGVSSSAIDEGFGVVELLLKKNSLVSAPILSWFAQFPLPINQMLEPNTSYCNAVWGVGVFLDKLSTRYTPLIRGALDRRFPYLVDELLIELECYSVCLQKTLFTSCRRRMGVLDGPVAHEMDAEHYRDQQQHMDQFGGLRQGAPISNPGEIHQRNAPLIRKYQELVQKAHDQFRLQQQAAGSAPKGFVPSPSNSNPQSPVVQQTNVPQAQRAASITSTISAHTNVQSPANQQMITPNVPPALRTVSDHNRHASYGFNNAEQQSIMTPSMQPTAQGVAAPQVLMQNPLAGQAGFIAQVQQSNQNVPTNVLLRNIPDVSQSPNAYSPVGTTAVQQQQFQFISPEPGAMYQNHAQQMPNPQGQQVQAASQQNQLAQQTQQLAQQFIQAQQAQAAASQQAQIGQFQQHTQRILQGQMGQQNQQAAQQILQVQTLARHAQHAQRIQEAQVAAQREAQVALQGQIVQQHQQAQQVLLSQQQAQQAQLTQQQLQLAQQGQQFQLLQHAQAMQTQQQGMGTFNPQLTSQAPSVFSVGRAALATMPNSTISPLSAAVAFASNPFLASAQHFMSANPMGPMQMTQPALGNMLQGPVLDPRHLNCVSSQFFPPPGYTIQRPDVPYDTTDKKSILMSLHQAHVRSPKRVRRKSRNGSKAERYYQAVKSFPLLPIRIPPTSYVYDFDFWVSDEQFALLSKTNENDQSLLPSTEYFDGSLRWRARCCQAKDGTQPISGSDWVSMDSHWPEQIHAMLNGNALTIRRAAHNGRDLAIELTPYIIPGQNSMRVVVPRKGSKSVVGKVHFIAVEMIETLAHSDVVAMVWTHGLLKEEETLNKIKARLTRTSDHDGVSAALEKLSIDMADPFSAVLFKVPARGAACTHMECFDLETWLNTRPSKPAAKCPHRRTAGSCSCPPAEEPSNPDKWRCPICFGDARPYSLRIDGFLLNVRRRLEAEGKTGVKSVLVESGGQWNAVVEEEDDLDSDDEIPLAEKRRKSVAGAKPGKAAKAPGVPQKEMVVIDLLDD